MGLNKTKLIIINHLIIWKKILILNVVFATLMFTWSSWHLLYKFEIFFIKFQSAGQLPFPVLFYVLTDPCPIRSLSSSPSQKVSWFHTPCPLYIFFVLSTHSQSSLPTLSPLYPLTVLPAHSLSFLPTQRPSYPLPVLSTHSLFSLPTPCPPYPLHVLPAHSLSFLPPHCSS